MPKPAVKCHLLSLPNNNWDCEDPVSPAHYLLPLCAMLAPAYHS